MTESSLGHLTVILHKCHSLLWTTSHPYCLVGPLYKCQSSLGHSLLWAASHPYCLLGPLHFHTVAKMPVHIGKVVPTNYVLLFTLTLFDSFSSHIYSLLWASGSWRSSPNPHSLLWTSSHLHSSRSCLEPQSLLGTFHIHSLLWAAS